jgi:hypothetical protein
VRHNHPSPELSALHESADSAQAGESDLHAVRWRTFLAYFLGLGTWGFGGPIATVGYGAALVDAYLY